MAKKNRGKKHKNVPKAAAEAAEANVGDGEVAAEEPRRADKEAPGDGAVEQDGGIASSSGEDDSSSDEDDDLVLEGVVRRVPGVSSSDEDEDISSEEGEDGGEDGAAAGKKKRARKHPLLPEEYAAEKERAAKKSKTEKRNGGAEQKKSKGTRPANKKKGLSESGGEPDTINVDFIFCDMNEKFFHGIKTLLMAHPVYAAHSSALSDLMIENISVGTVISTEGDIQGEENVFGFASVLNVTTNGSAPCVKYIKKLCLDNCPPRHKAELETVLSGKTRRPAGFLVHGRMVNTPLEITEVLHQQLVLDMDWAVKNADGGEEERKSLDFGAFVLMAPCTKTSGGGGVGGEPSSLIYKNFDDEIFASNAEFVYTFDAPGGIEDEEKQLCSVIVMTKTGHRDAMKDLAKLIGKGS